MKEIKFSTLYTAVNGDVFTETDFDFDALCRKGEDDYDKLSDFDKKRVESIYVEESLIHVPDSYCPASAEDMMGDIFRGDIETDYDAALHDSFTIRQIVLK